MNSRALLTFRTVVAGVLGIGCLLAASVAHGAFLPAALRSRPDLALVIELFGVGWMVQAAYLVRQRRIPD